MLFPLLGGEGQGEGESKQKPVKTLNLLPCPRFVKLLPGTLTLARQHPLPTFTVVRSNSAPNHPEGYALTISQSGIEILFRETPACAPPLPRCGR